MSEQKSARGKYQCNECKHVWEQEEWPDSCPDCGSDNFKKASSFSFMSKSGLGIIAAVVVILILIKIIVPPERTEVTVRFDDYSGKLTVKLEGKKAAGNYRIHVLRNGADFCDPSQSAQLTKVFESPGSYQVQVRWKGNKTEQPTLVWDGSPNFVVSEKPKAPEIIGIAILKRDFPTQRYQVSVKTDTGLVAASSTEYSVDGVNFQSSPVFANLKPGKYTFHVRNKKNNTMTGALEKELPKISKDAPSDSYINQLLSDIAQGDAAAFGKFVKVVENGNPLPVSDGSGSIQNSRALINYVNATQTVVRVRTTRDANNQIIKLVIN